MMATEIINKVIVKEDNTVTVDQIKRNMPLVWKIIDKFQEIVKKEKKSFNTEELFLKLIMLSDTELKKWIAIYL